MDNLIWVSSGDTVRENSISGLHLTGFSRHRYVSKSLEEASFTSVRLVEKHAWYSVLFQICERRLWKVDIHLYLAFTLFQLSIVNLGSISEEAIASWIWKQTVASLKYLKKTNMKRVKLWTNHSSSKVCPSFYWLINSSMGDHLM